MIVQASELKHALKRLQPVKTEIFRFDGGTIVAQDSDAAVSAPGPAFDGAFNANSKKLTSVVNRMGGQIEIERAEKSLVLKSAKARIELEIQPVKSVTLPKLTDNVVSFDLPEFKKALALAAASASPAKSASFGGSVQIQNLSLGIEDTHSPGYRIVGTDSIVLTVVTVSQPLPDQFKWLLNLTAASVVQIMDGKTLRIGESDTHLQLQSENVTVYASKPVQAYPNFDVLLVKKPTIKLSFKPADWLTAIKTVEPLIDEEKDNGQIALHFSSDVVQFLNVGIGNTASDEAGYEQLDPDPIFDPKEFDLRLSAKYLSGFLSKAGAEATLGIIDMPVRLESDNVVVLTMPGGKK
jgi:DNA polymerase III sliding clamp (beta) subunit (PCNA family)